MKFDSSILDFIRNKTQIDIKGKNRKWNLNNSRFRRFLATMTVIAVVGVSFVSYSVNDTRTKAYDVYLGDEHIGVVRTEDEALKVYSDLKESLKSTYDMGVVLDKELDFQETNAKDEVLTSAKDIESNIKDNINISVTGFELIVDGESFGIFKSGLEIEYILDTVKSSYLPQAAQDQEVEGTEAQVEKITTPKTHTVEDGDNYWTIARQYNPVSYTHLTLPTNREV